MKRIDDARLRGPSDLNPGGWKCCLALGVAWEIFGCSSGVREIEEVPSDGWVVWASNREDGRHEIYRVKVGGSEIVRLTSRGGKVPVWSPDGRWIAYHFPSDGSMYLMRPDGSEDHPICPGAPITDGVPAFWMHDGSGLVCTRPVTTASGPDIEYTLVDPESGASTRLFSKNEFWHLRNTRFEPGGITNDGAWLVGWAFGLYLGGYQGENGVFEAEHATVVLDLDQKDKVYFFGPGCLSATAPTGDLIYHVSRTGPTLPDIFSMSIRDLMDRSSYRQELGHEDSDWGHEYMPSISNDNQWMVYSASLGCHDWYACDYEVFIHRLGAGNEQRTRLTFDPGNDNFPSVFVGRL